MSGLCASRENRGCLTRPLFVVAHNCPLANHVSDSPSNPRKECRRCGYEILVLLYMMSVIPRASLTGKALHRNHSFRGDDLAGHVLLIDRRTHGT
jgi:hypothetical protein